MKKELSSSVKYYVKTIVFIAIGSAGLFLMKNYPVFPTEHLLLGAVIAFTMGVMMIKHKVLRNENYFSILKFTKKRVRTTAYGLFFLMGILSTMTMFFIARLNGATLDFENNLSLVTTPFIIVFYGTLVFCGSILKSNIDALQEDPLMSLMLDKNIIYFKRNRKERHSDAQKKRDHEENEKTLGTRPLLLEENTPISDSVPTGAANATL